MVRDESTILDADSRSDKSADFCREMLGGVSRTFALSIPELPVPLGDWVECAYLVCRMIDTLEDRPSPDGHDRHRMFDQLIAALGPPMDFSAAAAVASAYSQTSRNDPVDQCDALMSGGVNVMRRLASFPPPVIDAIRRCVAEMASGLRRTPLSVNGDRAVILFNTIRDLERYCHFAAGVIGVLLTRLFAIWLEDESASRDRRTLHRAKRFGRGLQLTNIIKDHPADLAAGRCFVPLGLAARCGYDREAILRPGLPAAIRAAIVWRAACHLDVALEYCLSLPASPAGIRLFCIQPMMMALLTLERVMTHHDPTPDERPKITRAAVEDVMRTSRRIAGDDAAIRRWHESLRDRVDAVLSDV